MSDIIDIKELTWSEIQSLRAAGINTTDDLWSYIGQDLNGGATRRLIGIDSDRLHDIITVQGLQEIESRQKSWIKRYWPELILLLCLTALAVLVLHAFRVFTWLPTQLGVGQPVVLATRDLPAYSIITSADITTTLRLSRPSNALSDPQAAVGQITKVPIRQSTPLTNSALQALPSNQQDWWLITVSVSPTLALQDYETVVLVGIDDSRADAEIISPQALPLGVQNGLVVLMLPPDQGLKAAAYQSGDRRLLVLNSLP